MIDLTGFGAAIVVGGAALFGVFAHLRTHSENFRKDNRERLDALRSRLGNELVMEFLTKFLPQIDAILKKSNPLAEVRQKLISAMTRNEPLEPALKDIRDVADKFPPTAEESKNLKGFAERLLRSFQRQEEIVKSFNDGYEQEKKAADQFLWMAFSLIGIGVLTIGASALYAADPADTGWLPSAGFLAFVLVLVSVVTGMDAVGRYRRSSAAQTKFLKAADAELYETRPVATNS